MYKTRGVGTSFSMSACEQVGRPAPCAKKLFLQLSIHLASKGLPK